MQTPTLTMQDVNRAVDAERPRIGQTVFVRYTRLGRAKPGAVTALLGRMVADTQDWIKQPPERIHANGSPRQGQVCLTVQFQGGATALITYGRGGDVPDGFDLLIIGNHGSMMCDYGTGLSADLPLPRSAETPADARIQSAIARALKSGQPQTLRAS